MKTEKIKLFFAEYRKLVTILVTICMVGILYCFIEDNYAQFLNMKLSPTFVSVVGTIVGAVIGGLCTIIGSISVSKAQSKAQANIRRKNILYRPIYDELVEIHNVILAENPFPRHIEFKKGRQTIRKHPQYSAWERIENDSRYLEMPKKLTKELEKLHACILDYQEQMSVAAKAMREIINQVFFENLHQNCSILHSENLIWYEILTENEVIFDTHFAFVNNPKNIETDVKDKICCDIIQRCSESKHIIECKQKYQEWMRQEEKTIELLATMIRYINLRYEA